MSSEHPVYAPRGYANAAAADDQPAFTPSLYPSLSSDSAAEEEEDGPRAAEEASPSAVPVLYAPRGHAALPNGDTDVVPTIVAANYPSLLPPEEPEPTSLLPPKEPEPTSLLPPKEAESASPFQYAPRGHAAVGEPSVSDAHAGAEAINADNYPSLVRTAVDERPPSEAPAQAPTGLQITTTQLTTRRQILGSQFARWRSRFWRRRSR